MRIDCAFAYTKFVHLQGWGEPLLNPRLFDTIKVAKDAGLAFRAYPLDPEEVAV